MYYTIIKIKNTLYLVFLITDFYHDFLSTKNNFLQFRLSVTLITNIIWSIYSDWK